MFSFILLGSESTEWKESVCVCVTAVLSLSMRNNYLILSVIFIYNFIILIENMSNRRKQFSTETQKNNKRTTVSVKGKQQPQQLKNGDFDNTKTKWKR